MAAEAAAIAYGAFEAVETAVQVGVGAYMVAKPTMPLKATFTQIATTTDDETRLSLTRFDHTLTVVDDRAYIFGGETASKILAGNEMHVVKLSQDQDDLSSDDAVISALPAIPNGTVPTARTKHAACRFKEDCIAIYGGIDQNGQTISSEPQLWLFDTKKRSWEGLDSSDLHAAPTIRRSAKLFYHDERLIVYGGVGSEGQALRDVWSFDNGHRVWAKLPDAPVSTSNAALVDGVLYLVSPNDNVSSDMHSISLKRDEGNDNEAKEWTTVPFPTNPLTPGPKPRTEAGLLPISTGYGRNYLVHFFGVQPQSIPELHNPVDSANPIEPSSGSAEVPEKLPLHHSDTWAYQIASTKPEIKPPTQAYEALKPAAIKDAIRDVLGIDSGKHSWCEVELVPPSDVPGAIEGKVHPGPRARFGCDVLADGGGIVLWGGVNAKGDCEGDGWIIKFE